MNAAITAKSRRRIVPRRKEGRTMNEIEKALKCCLKGSCTGCPRQAKEYPAGRADCKDLMYDRISAALRAEEEREKGCRYCKGYMFNNPLTGEQFATACGVPLKHCPNCGRKLDGGGQE